jgi:PAS domain S-box-containing protein
LDNSKEKFDELLSIIHFTENVAAKIHSLVIEDDIYNTVYEEFKKSKKYTCCILLLAENESNLKVKAVSLFPKNIKIAEKAVGIKLEKFGIDIHKSNIFLRVIQQGKYLHVKTQDIIRETIPQPLKKLAPFLVKVLGYKTSRTIITPLYKSNKIIGAFTMDSPEMVKEFIPSVQNLSRHISTALELADEMTASKKTEKALQESEGRYRAVAETTTAAIGIVDAEENFTFVNPAFASMVGYSQSEMLSMNLSQVSSTEDFAKYKQMTIERKKGKVSTYEATMICKDGRAIRLLVSASPLFDDNNAFTGTLAVVIDITDRREAEEKIRSLNETLEQRVAERTEQLHKTEERLHQTEKMEAIGQLAGGVAHDFNNQLAGIMGCADMLRISLKNNTSLYNLADTIVKAAERSSRLTNQLLAFARKGMFQSIPISIHGIIGEIVSILERSIGKNIKIKQYLEAQNPVVSGDPTQLQAIFLNLALNARDAMPEGGELKIITECVVLDKNHCNRMLHKIKPDLDYVRISITDTGIGMDMDTQKRIFEPFFTTKEKGKGTGIGLASVYGAVRNHSGAIEVKSKLGTGSTFNVYLPIIDSREAVPTDKIPQPDLKGSAKILLIDDEDIALNTTSKILQQSGYKVTVFNNGLEAVNHYRNSWQDIDLVILDIFMPEMGGKETFYKLQEINPDVQVLLCSGYSLDGESQKIIDQGALGFIQKPFMIDNLLQKISLILHNNNY